MFTTTAPLPVESAGPPKARGRLVLRGWALTFASLIAVTAVKMMAFEYVGPATPFLLYFASIIVGAWYDGWRGGLAATAVSAMMGGYFFLAPYHTFAISDASTAVRLAVFLFEGVAVTAITARVRNEGVRADTAAREAGRSLANLEAVMRGVNDGITVQSAEGKLIYANATAARLTGFASAQALLDAPVAEVMARFELLDEAGAPFPRDRLPGRLALQGAPAPEQLVRFRERATGHDRWAIVRASAVQVEGSDAKYAVNVFHDVTEERAQQEALRVSREWLSTTLRSIGDAVIATDPSGVITFMNAIAEELTGWESTAAEGRPLSTVFAIINEETRLPVASPVDLVLREGRVVGLANHTLLIRRDGTARPIDDSAAPIRSSRGDLVGTVLVFRDVSPRRADEQRRAFIARATTELASSIDYKSTLAMVVRLAVPTIADWCAVDMHEEGQFHRLAVAHVNPERVRLVYDIEQRYPESAKSPSGRMEVLRTGKPVFISDIPDELLAQSARDPEHLRLIRQLQLRSYIAAPLIANGTPVGVLTLAMAESGRRYDEKDLDLALTLADRASQAVSHARLFSDATAARRNAEQASRAKDEFLAMLGHELRNPLAPIVTALQLMKLRAPDVLQRERSIMERQAKYLIRLVDDLLDVSRITSGKVALAKEPVDLSDTLTRSLELAAPIIEERRHALVASIPEGLAVAGDQVRLAQVFANLLTNAAKYTEPGGRITVTAERQGEQMVVSVKDNGVGIPLQLLPRVFDLFIQGDQSADRGKGGLGLGLAIVRSVVEMHGGQVMAASDGPGQGSDFRVTLPALRNAAPADAPSDEVAPSSQLAGVKVLAVDDNKDALELLETALSMFGCETATCADPLSAIARAIAFRPDVALLDIGLPVMDGYELAGRLRASPGLEKLKLVAVTGYGQDADKEKARAAGFDDFLVKPIALEDVQRVLEKLMRTAAVAD